ncbi:hypothetical protein MIMGU_mgv1a004005mg [Erythranthe guttata]|uniref:Uncharacterized protein n=1 Tax=Erythranthe guttata TaxID=4155 RepID=A0A022QPA5_ERYGU|nr:hypothetical protein MIMGU_mgv1a004005mg [Erythranthe guttata]
MKGGIQGLKVSQVSFILVGLVCVTVLILAWTKTTLLTPFIPTQGRSLQLDLDEAGPKELLDGDSNSTQTQKKQVNSPGSSETPLAVDRGNIENVTTTHKEETPSSVIERTGSDEFSEGKNRSKQTEIVPESSSTVESPIKREQRGNLSDTTGNKETPSTVERLGSQELSRGQNKSEKAEFVPEVIKEQTRNLSAATGNKDCNYAKGKWVIDESLPLYSGFGCKQWLSSMWACRLTQRTDFEYEKLRHLINQKLTLAYRISHIMILYLTRKCRIMKDKTLAFIGDSLGRQQFQSLMCMVTGGEERHDVLDVGYEYGLVKARGAVRPDGWAYRFPITNTTILYYWSASLCDLEPIDPSNPKTTDFAMHLDRPPAFLRTFLPRFNVLVLNTGHHWNRGKLQANRWVMYVNGVPNTNRKIADIFGARNLTVHSIAKWVNEQLPLYPGLKAFLRTMSPRHFFNGDWNTGGTCDNTTPLSGGKEVVEDDSSDPLTAGAVSGTSVELLDITALSQLRDEGHISRYSIKATPGMQDCLHWCLPGIPDTWNEVLFARL